MSGAGVRLPSTRCPNGVQARACPAQLLLADEVVADAAELLVRDVEDEATTNRGEEAAVDDRLLRRLRRELPRRHRVGPGGLLLEHFLAADHAGRALVLARELAVRLEGELV